MAWQVQEAKQRFSEVLRMAEQEGPQVVTRHGEEVAVVVSMVQWREHMPNRPTLKDWLLNGPVADLDIERSRELDLHRIVDLSE